MAVLSNVGAGPGVKPFEPFWKGLVEVSSEGGNTGRRADWPCHIKVAEAIESPKAVILLRPSVQLPARDLRNGALIPIFSLLARETRPNHTRNRRFGACHALDMTASGGVLPRFPGEFGNVSRSGR